ncbi:MAG: Holliday junction branch migration protein RuvA [Alphaproteobacteria bacterium]
MIGKLTGVLDSMGEDWAMVDVGGVGYMVFCSGRTVAALGAVAEPVSLYIETHVREDHIHLYGFEDTVGRNAFRMLLTVQGVGARVALAILTVLPAGRLADAIGARDQAALSQASGVGAKLAGRIVSELRDKVEAMLPAFARASEGATSGAPPTAEEGETADAVSALVNLGYRRMDAFGAVAAAYRRLGTEVPVEELIRAGLQELSSGPGT